MFLPAARSGGRSRSHFVTQSVTNTQMSHLEASNAEIAQSKDVWNKNLEFLVRSADCLFSAVCLLRLQTWLGLEIQPNWYNTKLLGMKI